MKKNGAGQFVGCQMTTAADGTDFTGSVTVYVTGNAGAQAVGSVGSGACTHEGNGFHTYTPTQAETNYDHVAFTFKATGAITATVQVYPSFPQTGDNFALIGTTGSGLTSLASAANLATVAGYIDTEVAAIKTKTDFLPSATAGTAGGLFIAGANAATTVNITGTISTVTTLTNLPAITTGWLTAAGIAASALNGKGDWNIGKTGYSLTQTFPSNFSSLSITAGGLVDPVVASVAGAVWNAATASYGSAGSYGLLIETNLDAQVSTAGGGSLTAGAIADAVWDEAISGHLTAGSTGASLNGAGSAGDPWTATLGGYGAGSAGQIVYDNLNATVSSRATQTSVNTIDDFLDTEIAAIKAQTDVMPTAAGIADAVWDETLSDHAVVGSTGEALDNAGSGGGGVSDWTADEKTVIKAVLGIPGSGTTPDDPTTGILDTIRDTADAIKAKTDALPTDPADASVIAAAIAVTNGKIDVVDDLLDTEIAAIKADTAAIIVDTTDIQARIPAALVGGRMDSNLSAISNSTATMAAFNRAVKGNVIGTVGVGSTTTSIVTSSVTPAGSVADKFKGRLLTFSDDTTTVNLRGQSTDIISNTSAAAPTLTVTALTTSPVSGDQFVIT